MKAKKRVAPKLLFGVGINDADYVTQKWETIGYVDGKQKKKLVWVCPYYRAWANMLKRSYSKSYQEKNPTYLGCSVSEEWNRFLILRSGWKSKIGKTSNWIRIC